MRNPLIPGMMPNERTLQSEPAALGPPRLLWPSIMYTSDASHFPTEGDVHGRRRRCLEGDSLGLVAFAEAIAEAHRRLLVLDPHFDELGMRTLREPLNHSLAVEVRLLTGQSEDDTAPWRQDLERRINMGRMDHRKVPVEWRKLRRGSFPFLHDRFAVVDEALWHFGATIGGGHPGVNAASGPWSAAEVRAVGFFAECWRNSHA